MPHTWIGAEYILALRSLLAFEHAATQSLVLAAGIPNEWLADDFQIVVKDLPTYYGRLCYTLRRDRTDALHFSLFGDLAVPPGSVVVKPPLLRPIERVEGAGVARFDATSVTICQCPTNVVIRQQVPQAPSKNHNRSIGYLSTIHLDS
jgi:hypothetical protein